MDGWTLACAPCPAGVGAQHTAVPWPEESLRQSRARAAGFHGCCRLWWVPTEATLQGEPGRWVPGRAVGCVSAHPCTMGAEGPVASRQRGPAAGLAG